MFKLFLKLSTAAILFVVVVLNAQETIADAGAGADAGADAKPNPTPDAKADIIPGRVQNNPVLLLYDLLASLVASIPILGVPLVEILGLGRR